MVVIIFYILLNNEDIKNYKSISDQYHDQIKSFFDLYSDNKEYRISLLKIELKKVLEKHNILNTIIKIGEKFTSDDAIKLYENSNKALEDMRSSSKLIRDILNKIGLKLGGWENSLERLAGLYKYLTSSSLEDVNSVDDMNKLTLDKLKIPQDVKFNFTRTVDHYSTSEHKNIHLESVSKINKILPQGNTNTDYEHSYISLIAHYLQSNPNVIKSIFEAKDKNSKHSIQEHREIFKLLSNHQPLEDFMKTLGLHYAVTGWSDYYPGLADKLDYKINIFKDILTNIQNTCNINVALKSDISLVNNENEYKYPDDSCIQKVLPVGDKLLELNQGQTSKKETLQYRQANLTQLSRRSSRSAPNNDGYSSIFYGCMYNDDSREKLSKQLTYEHNKTILTEKINQILNYQKNPELFRSGLNADAVMRLMSKFIECVDKRKTHEHFDDELARLSNEYGAIFDICMRVFMRAIALCGNYSNHNRIQNKNIILQYDQSIDDNIIQSIAKQLSINIKIHDTYTQSGIIEQEYQQDKNNPEYLELLYHEHFELLMPQKLINIPQDNPNLKLDPFHVIDEKEEKTQTQIQQYLMEDRAKIGGAKENKYFVKHGTNIYYLDSQYKLCNLTEKLGLNFCHYQYNFFGGDSILQYISPYSDEQLQKMGMSFCPEITNAINIKRNFTNKHSYGEFTN